MTTNLELNQATQLNGDKSSAYEELSPEVRFNIALSIIAATFAGDSLELIEKQFTVTSETIQTIYQKAEEALTDAFQNKEEVSKLDYLAGVDRFKGLFTKTEPTVESEPKKGRKSRPDLTPQQVKKVEEVIKFLEKFNNEEGRKSTEQVKPSETLFKRVLELEKIPAQVVIGKIKDKGITDAISTIDSNVNTAHSGNYPVGTKAKDLTDAFITYWKLNKPKSSK